MSLKPKIEALIYATEEPITLDQMAALLKDHIRRFGLEPAATRIRAVPRGLEDRQRPHE